MTKIGDVTPAGQEPFTEVVLKYIFVCATFSCNVYGITGFVIDPSTVLKLLKDHSNNVTLPPFPTIENVTASFTTVDVLLEESVPAVVGVVQGVVIHTVKVPLDPTVDA